MKVNEIQGFLTEDMVEDLVRKGIWEPGQLFWKWWDKNAKQYPDKEAIVDAKNRLTWAQAQAQSVQLALGLRKLGLGKDDVVMAELPNCAEAQILRDALERSGIIFFFVATGFSFFWLPFRPPSII